MNEPVWLQNLVAYSLQMTVVAIVGSALPYVLKLRAPRIMLAYWQALAVTCLALPVLEPWKVASVIYPAAGAGDVAIEITMRAVNHQAAWWSLPTLVLVVLAAVAVGRLAWLVVGSRRLRSYRRRASVLVKRPDAVQEMARAMPVSATFYVSDEISVPATFGRIDPVILLPKRFLEMEQACQRAIICHELLHVARSDWTWNIAEEVILALFWFHPAAWWLASRIRLTREQVVDSEVVRLTRAPKPYLEALIEIAQQRTARRAAPAPLFLGEGQLAQRVSLMVTEVAMSKRRLVASTIAMATALIFSGCLAVWAFPLRIAPAAPALHRSEDVEQVEGGVKGGVSGGAVGGVIGGVPGGVIGGVVGGVIGGVGSATEHARHVDVRKLSVVHQVPPHYPPLAKQAGIEGIVTMDISVNAQGEVTNIHVVSGPDLLVKAALDAVAQWKFEPSPLLPASTTIEINFTLKKNEHKAPRSASNSGTVSESGTELQPVYTVDPVYPPLAKMAGIQGSVIVDLTIEKDGSVSKFKFVSGHPLLANAALDAVRQWRYEPSPKLPATTRVTINFSLPDAKSSKDANGVPSATHEDSEVSQPTDQVYAVGGDIKAPQPVSTPDPSYTNQARKARLKGTAIFSIVVNENGNVISAKELSKPLGGGLDESAQTTLRQWKFQPAVREGKPVAVRIMVETTFRLY